MPVFPISDPARGDDIRARRRRALLLIASIVAVPWMMLHRSHPVAARDAVPAGSERSLQAVLDGVMDDVVRPGLSHLSVTTDALPEPAAGAPARRFAAGRLTVDLSCAGSVTLLPRQGAGDEVIVSVRPGQEAGLQALTVKDGVVEQQAACDDGQRADFIVQAAPARPITLVQEGDIDIRGGRFGGTVTLEGSGSGSVSLGSTGTLIDTEHASGDVTVGEVDGNVSARLLGSGDLRVPGGSVAHLSVESHGSGDVSMGHAELGDCTILLNGSGNFSADQVVGPIDATTHGSGDIAIASIASGRAHLQGDGSGDIVVRGGHINVLTASRQGSGDLEVRAVIGSGTLVGDGSGDIALPNVTGRLDRPGRQDKSDEGG